MAYESAEKETVCVFDYVTKTWTVYSSVPTHITKLTQRCGEPVWKEEEEGRTGRKNVIGARWNNLAKSQVRFAKLTVTDEEDEEDEGEEVADEIGTD